MEPGSACGMPYAEELGLSAVDAPVALADVERVEAGELRQSPKPNSASSARAMSRGSASARSSVRLTAMRLGRAERAAFLAGSAWRRAGRSGTTALYGALAEPLRRRGRHPRRTRGRRACETAGWSASTPVATLTPVATTAAPDRATVVRRRACARSWRWPGEHGAGARRAWGRTSGTRLSQGTRRHVRRRPGRDRRAAPEVKITKRSRVTMHESRRQCKPNDGIGASDSSHPSHGSHPPHGPACLSVRAGRPPASR